MVPEITEEIVQVRANLTSEPGFLHVLGQTLIQTHQTSTGDCR
jgi:hypothetical protein